MAKKTAAGRKVGGQSRSLVVGTCRPKAVQFQANEDRLAGRVLEALAAWEAKQWEGLNASR